MPWISRILDFVTLPATRGFFNRISGEVYNSTGYRFHPAMFQMIGALVVVMVAYWMYVANRRTKI